MNSRFSLLIMLLLCGSLCAQSPYSLKFKHLSTEDGLSQASVTGFLKDRYGFMWVGTRDGLNRYDSYGFTQFRSRTNDTTSISNNTISCLLEDSDGMLWIGTEGGGLNQYDPITDRFSRFSLGHAADNEAGHIINDVFEDRQGNIWIATDGSGLLRYARENAGTENFTVSMKDNDGDSLSHIVSSVTQDSEGLIWFTTEGSGLVRLDPGSGDYTVYSHDPEDSGSICSDFVSQVFEDSRGRLWILSWGYGLSLFDKTSENFRTFVATGEPGSLANNNVFSIAEDNFGNIWLGTRDGLSAFDEKSQSFFTHNTIPGNLYSLSDNVVFSLFHDDREEILWVGTWGNGINILDRKGRNTRHYQHIPDDANSLSSDNVFAFLEDRNGNLWIGTEGSGLNRFDPRTNSFKSFVHDPGDPASISNNDIMSIHQDKAGSIWIGTYGGGLNKLNPETGEFQTIELSVDGQNAIRTVLSIHETPDGMLWLTTSLQGIARLDPRTMEIDFFRESTGFREGSFNDLLVITSDHAGKIWVGTRNSGLVRFDPENEAFTFYQHDPQDSESLGANGVYALHEDSNHNLWIGTRGSGLNILDLSGDSPSGTFQKLTTEQGLFNDWVLGLEEDAEGNVWASGEGISKIGIDTRTLESYYFTSANQGAFYKSPSTGHFYLGAEGFDVFHPDSIQYRQGTPILISSLYRYNSVEQAGIAIPVPGIFAYDSLVFDYTDQILAFEFLNLDYNSNEARRYIYRLENFNQEWIHLGEERKITFTGLSAGDYVLKVKTILPNGMESEQEASLAFTILPPWWNSESARILYVLIAVTGLYSIYYWRTVEQRRKIRQKEKELKRERKLNDRLQQVDKLKDQFLANTSHELRTPLQGIIGLSESLQEKEADGAKRRDLSMIIASGKRLANLVNSILDFSKLKSQDITLDLKPVDLRSITDVVLRMNQPLIKGKQLKLNNNVPMDLPMIHADENRLQQILHNLVGNAVKFTETGHITVSAVSEDRTVLVSVEDTGIGIPQDKHEQIFKSFEQVEDSDTRSYEGTGLGLSITKNLIELMGGTIMVKSAPGKGSTFLFTLAISPEQQPVRSSPEIIPAPVEPEEETGPELVKSNNQDGEQRILVVDDEIINQQVIGNYLSDDAYQVDFAHNGHEALEMINKNHYDAVLLDIMMPSLSGYEVCLRIRQQYLSSELPVIMITARNQTEDLVKGFSTGANDYITKPFSKGELLSRIKTHLNLSLINKSNTKFIPAEFLRSIGKETILDVKLGDQSLLEVTVMFSDIRSYTTLSESMSPDENFNFLNRYLSYISPLIKKNNGFINQFLGDGIMAIFIESPEDSVTAGIEMQCEVAKFNEMISREKKEPVNVGIGLHTGQLMMGILGDKDRMEASVVSDTVNTASRMEGLTKYFGAPVVISETTYDGLTNRNEADYRYLGRVKVKGKTREIKVYEVLDGNTPETRELKLASQEHFEAGLKEYFNKSFATASVCFEKALKIYPDDQATLLYLKNSARFMVEGVDNSWDGVESLETK